MDRKALSIIRSAAPDDKNLIRNAWLKGTQNSFAYRGVPYKLFYELHAEVVENLLRHSKILIAANPENLSQIFGFIVYEASPVTHRLVVHYIYVKEAYRRLKIASALKQMMVHNEYPDEEFVPITATHMTAGGSRLAKKWEVIYNPYLLMKGTYGFSKSS